MPPCLKSHLQTQHSRPALPHVALRCFTDPPRFFSNGQGTSLFSPCLLTFSLGFFSKGNLCYRATPCFVNVLVFEFLLRLSFTPPPFFPPLLFFPPPSFERLFAHNSFSPSFEAGIRCCFFPPPLKPTFSSLSENHHGPLCFSVVQYSVSCPPLLLFVFLAFSQGSP